MKDTSLDFHKMFGTDRDGVCAVKRGRIIYANGAFQMLFTDRVQGRPIEQLLPEINPYIDAESYVSAVTIGGIVYTVTAAQTEAGLILKILRPEQSAPGISPSALAQMRSAAFSLRISLDKLLPRDTENEDPNTRILYHSYFTLLHLINQLSDVAALSKGEMYCRMQTLELTELVRELVGSVTFFMGDTDVPLICRLPEESCFVQGDREKLQQLLLILLNNSLRHTRPGGSVTVVLQQTVRQYILSVDDTGEGMTGTELGWAFTPRESPPLTSANSAGMGLHIAYGLARLHGGTIMLQSEPGKGTRVRLTLPVSGSLPLRDSAPTLPQSPDQILTELANVLPYDAYHPKFRG